MSMKSLLWPAPFQQREQGLNLCGELINLPPLEYGSSHIWESYRMGMLYLCFVYYVDKYRNPAPELFTTLEFTYTDEKENGVSTVG